ncbi:MAG TPA: DUF4112 domain-containing protein [Chitinophagaceae bacterium]|nr:DUF4112 domain-containing protein [Chitinophagaceae bacterium]
MSDINKPVPLNPSLNHIRSLAKLMDSKFMIPGTRIRFGLDALIGLIPGAGDLSTFAVSGYMVMIMAKNGASGFVLSRMIINILVDAIIGAIPFIGDIFDIAFKANNRNMRLMEQYYTLGKHRGSAWKAIIPILIIVLLMILGILWLTYKLLVAIF